VCSSDLDLARRRSKADSHFGLSHFLCGPIEASLTGFNIDTHTALLHLNKETNHLLLRHPHRHIPVEFLLKQGQKVLDEQVGNHGVVVRISVHNIAGDTTPTHCVNHEPQCVVHQLMYTRSEVVPAQSVDTLSEWLQLINEVSQNLRVVEPTLMVDSDSLQRCDIKLGMVVGNPRHMLN